MRKLVSILLTLALAVSLTLVAVTPVAAQTTRNVPDDYATIQAAIDAADDGDTIIVAAGTYNENVVVDKSLILQGEDKETTIIQSQLEGGMYGTYGDRVVIIEANDVSVSGFTLSGYTSTPEKRGTTAWPLYADGYNNLEASDNIFTFYTQGGIRFLDGDNILIKDTFFQRETRSIWYDPPGAEPGSYVDRTYGGMGPELWGCTNATIDPNVIETYAVGISIMGCDGVSIEDNIVSAPDTTTPSDSGIHIQSSSDITVAGNSVSNFTAGEKAGYNNGTTGAGIRILSSNENVTVEGNELHHNTVGVLVTGASGSPEIHRNNIEDNGVFGVLNCASWVGKDRTYTPASVTIDATENWWGHASGPSGEYGRVNPAGKVIGKGDAVSDNVEWDPWLPQPVKHTKHDPLPPGLLR